VALLVGVLIWGILVLQAVAKWSGGYCEDFAICFEAKPLALAIQGTIALVGAAAATGVAILCIRYARGGDLLGSRLVRRAIVVVVCVAAWVVYTDAAGVASWRTT
jgi:hypothetical protein